nr:hypothetical protein [Clavibacter californiensis]
MAGVDQRDVAALRVEPEMQERDEPVVCAEVGFDGAVDHGERPPRIRRRRCDP